MISFYFDRITWMLAVSVSIISPKICQLAPPCGQYAEFTPSVYKLYQFIIMYDWESH